MNRRELLKTIAVASGAALLPIGWSGWAATGQASDKRLIVIFLRGAVDGLNVVAPYGDQAYYDARPTIAVARPGGDEFSAIPLDRYFGLNPGLRQMMPLWQQGSLAFVHAFGSPDPSRSHFDAQLFMENGTPGKSMTADGWMNRLLAALPGPHAPTEGVSFGAVLPRIMSGPVNVANLPLGNAASRALPLDQPAVSNAFDRMYAGDDALSRSYREGQEARKQLLVDMSPSADKDADNGAPPPKGFAADAARLALMIRQDPTIRVAFMDLGGWDTHVGEGNGKGQLANRLGQLGDGLVTLASGLGPAYQDTLILVMSEFGRTFRENGNGGTDHGHGNALWLMGGPVRGGQVYGDWPGIGQAQLHEGRDLAVTSDFRTVIGALVERHLRLPDRQLAQIFPTMPKGPANLAKLLRV
jgi:uncharacterized protein (DUF1501 family)